MRRWLTERTVHDNYAICSSLWTFAAQEFGFRHVISKVERPTFKPKEIVPFTQREIQAILEAAE
jgi:hypothetical protein